VCTYQTTTLHLDGSAKGARGWFGITDGSVYVDHPVHLQAGHAVLIDLRAPDRGPDARIALELDAASARALAASILRTLDAAPPGLLADGLILEGGGVLGM
jgi:Family of unknown function (DUF6295)